MAGGTAFVPAISSPAHFFAFAGNYPSNNESAISYVPPPSHVDEVGLLWSFNVDSGLWTKEKSAGFVTGIQGGSSATNSFLNEGYYLGGMQDSWVLENAPDVFFEGMMVLNMTEVRWTNETVPGGSTLGGFMEYLPIGEKGALVVFGGRNWPEGVANPDSSIANDMRQILIYDVSSKKWLSQNATGTPDRPNLIPASRVLGCSSLVSAPDNSSHNIYVFDGETQLGGPRVNDIWVLTLPSFNWIRITDDTIGAVGHSCHSIGRQMILVGSDKPTDSHAKCQEFFRVFDLTSLEWTNQWDSRANSYLVPPVISAIIGGNETGGATSLSPKNDTDSWTKELFDVFAKTPWGPANSTSQPPRPNSENEGDAPGSPTRPTISQMSVPSPSGSKSSNPLAPGVVAGISIASIVTFLLAILAFWFIFKKHSRKPSVVTESGAGFAKPELPAGQTTNGGFRAEQRRRSFGQATETAEIGGREVMRPQEIMGTEAVRRPEEHT